MTVNPPVLLDVRALLQPHLHLSAVELGISGDTSHVKEGDSYHLGRPQQRTSGYAATESSRDHAGLNEYACALDVGYWSLRVGGKSHDLRSFSIWAVAQCKANTADSRDIREIIYSTDGKTVKRWDRLGRRSTGDDSHLSHTHFSFFRDAIKAGRDQRPLFRRYLQEIGLIEGEDDVTADENWNWHWAGERKPDGTPDDRTAWTRLRQIGQSLETVTQRLDTLAASPAGGELTDADRADIAAKVLAGLPDTLAEQLADKLATRLQD